MRISESDYIYMYSVDMILFCADFFISLIAISRGVPLLRAFLF
jgi:hypothetical protein